MVEDSKISRITIGFVGIVSVLILWLVLALLFAIRSWFEPAPSGSMKIDAFDEIRLTATLLNVALPLGFLTVFGGFYLAVKKVISTALPLVGALIFIGLSVGCWQWWQYMDAAHGLESSLTQDHLWWGGRIEPTDQ